MPGGTMRRQNIEQRRADLSQNSHSREMEGGTSRAQTLHLLRPRSRAFAEMLWSDRGERTLG